MGGCHLEMMRRDRSTWKWESECSTCNVVIKCDFLSVKYALAELSIDIYYNRIDLIILIYICIKYHFSYCTGQFIQPQ